MPVTAQTGGPYAPGSSITGLVERYRDKGLQAPINGDVLARAGVSESLIPRTLQSLRILDLIDEEGHPTATLERLRVVPQAEYQGALAEWIKGAYAEVFLYADPSIDGEVRVRDAFRTYSPHGQQDRMVKLFLALCVAAGLAPEKPTKAERATTGSTNTNGRTPAAAPRAPRQASTRAKVQPPAGGGGVSDPGAGLPPALAGLMKSLPLNGKSWTQAKRDQFVLTFGSVLDFVIPIANEADEGEGS